MINLVFIIAFLYAVNRVSINASIVQFLLGRTRIQPLQDAKKYSYIEKITGLKFTIKTIESTILFGFATGFKRKPYIFVSTAVLKKFTFNELQWLFLHEAGHCVLNHPIIMGLMQGLCILIGISTSGFFHLNTLMFCFLFVVSVCSYFFLARELVELKADEYSLQRMSDPHGMITANRKMKAAGKSIFYKNKLLQFLFTPHPTYDERISMAEKELIRRRFTNV